MVDKELMSKMKEEQGRLVNQIWSVQERIDLVECILNGIHHLVISKNGVFPNRSPDAIRDQWYKYSAKLRQGFVLNKEGVWIKKK